MTPVNDVHELSQGEGFWYVASPYTKYRDGLEAAYLAAWDISSMLKDEGVKHYCPIATTHDVAGMTGIDPRDGDFWLAFDRPLMVRAKGLVVVTLDGWDESDGIAKEIDYFAGYGKPICSLDPGIVGWVQ